VNVACTWRSDGISYTASFRAWIFQCLRLVKVVPRYFYSGDWGYSSFKMIAMFLRRFKSPLLVSTRLFRGHW
jgi:hypothetical protein